MPSVVVTMGPVMSEPRVARATLRCDRCRTYLRFELETNQLAPREVKWVDALQVLAVRMGWTGRDRAPLDLAAGDGHHLCPVCATPIPELDEP